MLSKDYLQKQIIKILSTEYGAAETATAARYAIDILDTTPSATVDMVIARAKWYAKHNHLPAAPKRTAPIVKARLPARGINR
ncbi:MULTISPECIES: hypothetical protein [Serratia]|uniref:Uncharacterized protein n=1 Tax=Serratia quinivorans TaxID=137545 RepID=A0A379YEP6_9GAMM|nr:MULTISPECIES: hypothetical protein [Serratia]RYM66284.1 hypothetical protein BSR03_01560 [Serratia proteamaculans]CAI1830465.1 Uncharacterised protein [Serratia quinivorans]SUI44183.1 Uncharacterised protein [Serratia quinivorans]